LPVNDVIRAVVPDADTSKLEVSSRHPHRRRKQSEDGWFNIARGIGLKFRWPGSNSAKGKEELNQVLPIRGVRGDLPVKFEDGGALPGDRIVGVLTEGEGIRIFQIHSPKLKDYEHESWIDVTWDFDTPNTQRFPTRISVTALNEPGTLAQIAQVIGEADGNIDNVRMVRRAPDFTEMLIEIEVWDLEHLNHIMSGLKSRSVISKVERVFS
jgi:GTP pyrophosphokinase